jgi:hypothetical protein
MSSSPLPVMTTMKDCPIYDVKNLEQPGFPDIYAYIIKGNVRQYDEKDIKEFIISFKRICGNKARKSSVILDLTEFTMAAKLLANNRKELTGMAKDGVHRIAIIAPNGSARTVAMEFIKLENADKYTSVFITMQDAIKFCSCPLDPLHGQESLQ